MRKDILSHPPDPILSSISCLYCCKFREMWWLLLPLAATALPSVVVERRSVVSGTILSSSPVPSLKLCSDQCSKVSSCTGFSFVIDAAREAHCLLVDGSKQPGESEQKLLAEAVLYSGKRLELNDSSCSSHRSFSFERWPFRMLKNNASVLETVEGLKLTDCLTLCLRKEKCLSVIYQHDRCTLSAISPNTVYNTRAHYEYVEESDLYENNCRGNGISQFDGQCNWMRVKSAGLPDQWDSKEKTADVEDCEKLCGVRDRGGDPCRSYTFDSKLSTCYLSQVSARLSGRSALENHDKRYSHGDLDDCTDFSLHCGEKGLELRGTSIRQFGGYVRTKEGKQMICNKEIKPSYEYSVKMGFEECGFKRTEIPFSQYREVVHIKEGSTPLITIRDKILQVECRLHNQMPMTEQTLAISMQIEEGNRTEKVLSNKVLMVPSKAPPVPKYSLRVLDYNGSPSDTVRYGEHGWVQIILNQKEVASSFSVSKLEARDTKNSIRVALLDDEGCVTNGSIVERISRPDPGEVKFLVNYEFFDQGAEIVFYAYAEPCSGNCDPKCNHQYFEEQGESLSSAPISMRTRRSITAMQMELSQDLYPLHGSRVILLGSKPEKVFQETKVDVEQSKIQSPSWTDSFLHCLFQDSTCFFSFTLALIQFCLVVMCILVMYCYLKQYRRYRALSSPPPPSTVSPVQETKY